MADDGTIAGRRARIGAMRGAACTMLLAGALVLGACGGDKPSPHATPAKQGATTAVHRARSLAPPAAHGSYHGAVPILMYHVIGTPPAGAPYPELWVPAARFRAQLKRLAGSGYHGVTLAQVWTAWHGGPGLPRHPVVVSFDDGYYSQYRIAAPALRKLGWRGVLNLEVHNLHVAGGLSERQVRSMLARGWEVDAHTLTHPDLTTVDATRLKREVAGSRASLQHRFKVPVAFFCYPSGRYDATVVQAVRSAGYKAATTTQPGLAARNGDRFALPRFRVLPTMTPATLLATLR
jgi:peptidoglycan/xylan/chitin deacetylase (PgdA/CDA1 family)